MNMPEQQALKQMAIAERPMTLAEVFPGRKNWMPSLIRNGWAISVGEISKEAGFGYLITDAGRLALMEAQK